MKIIEKIKRALLLPLVGLLFATSLIAPSTPVYADPVPETVETTETTEETETPAETADETEETEESETSESTEVETTEGATCISQVGTIGWIVCPTAAFLAKAVDNIYHLVEDLLVVQPISTEENSPVFMIWVYVRNITNIVFIILFLVIIYSQLTGFGISNYGIKKALPKLIIAAILVNLSYIICAFAVDLSNIIGAGIKNFIEGIMTEAINNGTFSSQDVSVSLYQVFTAIAAGGVIGGLAIGFSGGPLGLLLALIPVILGGIISVAIGLLTISLRHAIIILLIVVSPLAMIAYILPNTEKWHKKWVEVFTQMIVFFPLFALLFGASKLASWLLISASTSMTGVILGLAIQVLPLFLAVKLMKMSGTVLGTISSALDNLGNKATGATAAAIEPYKEYARKMQLANNMRKPFNPLSGGSWRALSAKGAAKIEYKNTQADKLVKGLQAENLNATRMNKRIIAYDENNKPIYSHVYRHSSSVNNVESAAGEAALREQISTTQADMYNSSLDSYYTANNVKRGRATKTAKHMGQHYFDYRNALLAKARTDESDERWYVDQVNKIIARDKVTAERGESIHNLAGENDRDHKKYLQFVKDVSGSDGYTINGVNDHEFTVAPGTISDKTQAERFADAQRAVINVLGDVASYDKTLREGTRKRYEAFLDTQETSIVADYYKSIINNKDFEGFLATNHIFSRRGDYDKVAKGIDEFLKGEEFNLGDYRTSALALDLLAMKDAAPALGRLGKFINMETWRYSQGDRRTAKVDIEQYVTGIVKDERDALGNSYRTKIDLAAALEGTSFMKMDRTGLDAQRVFMDSAIASANLDYNSEVQLREKVGAAMLPALLTASLSMESGSEAHRAVMRELTGMKLNPDTGKWKDATRSDAERRAVEVLFNEYLNGHTASNVASLKTEGWGAIVARSKEIIKATPGGEALSDEALAEEVNKNMRNIWASQIAVLKKSSGYHVANMKTGIAEALGINQNAASQVNSLNTTTHTDNDDAENRGGGDGGDGTGNGHGNSDGNGNGGNGGNGHGRGGNGDNGGDSNSINYAGLTGAGGGQGGGSGSSNDPKPFQLGSPSSPDSGATRQDISDLKDAIDNLSAILKDKRDEYHEEFKKNKEKGRL